MIRVLVADDEPLIRAGIATVLESTEDIRVVASVGTGQEAVDRAVSDTVDVALLDIKMLGPSGADDPVDPTTGGLATAEQIRERVPGVRVVMLTSFGAQPNVARALQHGAVGFLLKNCTPDELIRAVRAAQAGHGYLSPPVTRMVLGMATPPDARRRREAAQRLAALTPREADVVHLVAEGLANAEIGRRLHMSEATIKTYVSRILGKLECTNRVQAALLVHHARD